MKIPEINQMPSGMIVKFAPDFILLKKAVPQQLYFLDVKHSVSPIWAQSRLEKFRKRIGDENLQIADVGVIAREALLAYRRYYPGTIILMVSPYNPKLVMAQFAEKVKCIYCYRTKGMPDYDCSNCPSKSGDFFDIERATNSTGSQTPMTDVDLRSFEPADEFFSKLGINVNKEILEKMKETTRKEELIFDEKVFPKIKNSVCWQLNKSGCDWIDYEVYTKDGNDFLHLSSECSMLKLAKGRLTSYKSLDSASAAGKRQMCKFCSSN